MHVQPNALAFKAIQHMVLYCLTPPPFDRYSCLNLCPPSPARDGIEPNAGFAEDKGICLVNSSRRSVAGNWPLTTGHWPLFFQGVHVA
jgi:hypothetical protein